MEKNVTRLRPRDIEQMITDKHAARNAGASPSSIHQRPKPQVQYEDSAKRYTKEELDGGRVVATERGPRREMLEKERELVEE